MEDDLTTYFERESVCLLYRSWWRLFSATSFLSSIERLRVMQELFGTRKHSDKTNPKPQTQKI